MSNVRGQLSDARELGALDQLILFCAQLLRTGRQFGIRALECQGPLSHTLLQLAKQRPILLLTVP